jgi:hypothetical protein
LKTILNHLFYTTVLNSLIRRSPHIWLVFQTVLVIVPAFITNNLCGKLNDMMIKRFLFQALLLSGLGLIQGVKLSATPPGPVSSQPAAAILYWNEVAYNAFGGTKYQNSLMASRINAMVHLAMHDALNGIEEKFSRYAFKGRDVKADPLAAAASAAHAVLIHEIPDSKRFVDSALTSVLRSLKDGEGKSRGMALGVAAAKAVINKRENDGSAGNPIAPVPSSVVAGVYQHVPPFNFAFAPYWEDVEPFALEKSDQFRPASYPSLQSPAYKAAFNEVKEMGKLNSKVRSQEQTAYAQFWYEFSESGWNRVARVVTASQNLNMLEAARLFALVDMAMADAYIAGWDAKLYYNFWRPYTAIRNSGSDAAWEPLMPTPPIHDYPSTHSVLGNAAATVLAYLLGDNTTFSMTSPTAVPAGTSRSFSSFSQAADENADSRVMAGIHFRFSCKAGQDLGNKIGAWTVGYCLMSLE